MTRAASFLIVLLFVAALIAVQHGSKVNAGHDAFSSARSNVSSVDSQTLRERPAEALTSSVSDVHTSPDLLFSFLSAASNGASSGRPARPPKALPLLGMAGLGSLVAGFIMRR